MDKMNYSWFWEQITDLFEVNTLTFVGVLICVIINAELRPCFLVETLLVEKICFFFFLLKIQDTKTWKVEEMKILSSLLTSSGGGEVVFVFLSFEREEKAHHMALIFRKQVSPVLHLKPMSIFQSSCQFWKLCLAGTLKFHIYCRRWSVQLRHQVEALVGMKE